MPSSPTWEDTVEDSPSWDDTVEDSEETSQAVPFDDPLMASAATLGAGGLKIEAPQRGVLTASGGPQIRTPGDGSFGRQVGQGIREVPAAAGELVEELIKPILAPTEIEPRSSLVGLNASLVPTGARISENTGLPRAVTVPASGAGRALAGLGEFLTSPVGAAEVGVAAIPGIGLLQRAKFIKDMAQGAGESGGRLTALVESNLKNPDKVSDEDAQEMAEESANTLLMLFGAGKLTSSQFSQLTGVRAPLGRVVESQRTRLAKDLAEQLKKSPVTPSASTSTPVRQLGIPQAQLTAEPFLQPGVPELADAALREAQTRVVAPGQEGVAANALRQAVEPTRLTKVEPTRLAERIEGGGEAPYGKVSYQRAAEAPTVQPRPVQTVAEVAPKTAEPQISPGVDQFNRSFSAGEKISTEQAVRSGMESRSVADLDAMLSSLEAARVRLEQSRKAYAEETNPQRKMEIGNDMMRQASTVQLPREAIEGAVNIGGNAEGAMGVSFGPRPLDFRNSPEVSSWVRRNAEKIWTDERNRSSITEQLSESAPSKAAPDLISRLESLKFSEATEGRLYSLPHPDAIVAIGRSTWNSAVDVAIASVKAGKAIKEAVDDALAYLRRQGKKFDETQARANMEFVASQETRPATAPASAAPTATAARPSIKAPTLDDIYKIFEPAPGDRPGVKETAVKAIESIRTGFSSRFRPIDKLAEDIAKAYGTVSKKGIAGIFEQLKGSSGKAEADIYRFDQAVSNKVRGAEKDFSAYMFLRRSLDRLNQDIADRQAGLLARRSVSSYTIPELQSKLATLENQLGPEKLKAFQETSELYQQQMDASLRLQVESGRMSQEVYNAIKESNQFYAPFKVLKYIEEGMKPEGTSRKVDTLADFTKAMEGIESPDFKLGDMIGAARQNIALSRILAEKNNTMRKFADLADQDVNSTFTQKLKPGQESPLGMEVVNVLRNGKQERYAVNRDVAQAVQLFGDTANSFGARVLRMASVPFRAGATALNIPFQFANLMADVPRAALVSRYGVRGVTDLVRYPLDMIDALYSSMLGNVVGYKNKLFIDFLDSGAAGTTIQEYLTPQGLKFQKNSIPAKLADKALYSLPNFSTAIEQMSKVLGVKRAMRLEKVINAETGKLEGIGSGKALAQQIPEAITEIRRFSGSPDFGRQGRWVEEARLNLIYMFLNARIQGTTADVGRLIGRDGAKEAALMWGKMGLAVGVPTAYLYSLNRSSEYADDYDKRPKQEKENYWLIPKDTFITNEQGEKMRDYWRIPKRESAKWISNSLEAALDFAEKKDTATFANWAETMMEEITPVNIQGDTFPQRLESVGASLNPIIKAPLELATGRDMYRHRDTVPDAMQKASPSEQYTDRTAEVFKSLAAKMPDVMPDVFQSPIMLESLVRNLSAGLVTQFLPRRPIEGRGELENAALLQRFQALPYTDQEKFKTDMEALERSAADEQVRRYRNANNFVRENKGKPFEANLKLAAQTYAGDRRQIERILDLMIAERNGITSQERQVLALPVQQRAAYLANQFKDLNGDQKAEAFRNYARKRILTEGVAVELQKLMNPNAPEAPPQPAPE